MSVWIQPEVWAAHGAGPAAHRRPLVLFVEDDVTIREMYRMQLVNDGMEVVVASDGAAGLEAARRRRPDLVLLDLRLPEVDGFAVLAALKSDPDLLDVPVLVLSNYGDPDMVRRGRGMGATDYLIKSRTMPGDLSRRVRELLGRASALDD